MALILFHIRSIYYRRENVGPRYDEEGPHENFGSYVSSDGEFRSVGTNAHLPG
jgi:hypothetical protein